MNVIDVLDRGVDRITKGWVQGKMVYRPSFPRDDPRVSFCLLGSLQEHDTSYLTHTAAEMVEAKREAELLIVRAISELHPDWNRYGTCRILNANPTTSGDQALMDSMCENYIANFNDNTLRRWSEVLAVMIRARELANDTLIASNISAIESDLATAGD